MSHQKADKLGKPSWTVTTEKEEIVLDPTNLLDLIFSKVNKVEKDDFAFLLEEFFRFLNASNRALTMTPEQIATLSFSVGYYYRLFLQKNNVDISYSTEQKEE